MSLGEMLGLLWTKMHYVLSQRQCGDRNLWVESQYYLESTFQVTCFLQVPFPSPSGPHGSLPVE